MLEKSQADYYGAPPIEGKGEAENGLADDVCPPQGNGKRDGPSASQRRTCCSWIEA